MTNKITCILAALLMTGCSTYSDPRISTTKPASGLLQGQSSYFCQHGSYATEDSVYRGGYVLSHLLGFWTAREVELVRFKVLSKDEFASEYLDKNLNITGSRHYLRGQDYQVGNDGALEIKSASQCGSNDSPGVGCSWGGIKLFLDQTGNLAVIQTNSGAGLIGIVPVASGSNYLSLFPPVADSAGSLSAGLAQCPESHAAQRQREAAKQKVLPSFAVGDIVTPYRHYDATQKEFLPGPYISVKDTRWRVKEITDQYVRLELIEGEYKPSSSKAPVYKAGEFSTTFFSSGNYKAAHPYAGGPGQIFEEFKKVE